MKLGLSVGQWNAAPSDAVDLVKRAEDFGYDSAWTAETYGTDAITPLAFLAAHTRRIKLGTAIAQLDARTPANLAMCCQTIEVLGGEGRMMLGIGASGPQIVASFAAIRDAIFSATSLPTTSAQSPFCVLTDGALTWRPPSAPR